jgi:hypothetical protein
MVTGNCLLKLNGNRFIPIGTQLRSVNAYLYPTVRPVSVWRNSASDDRKRENCGFDAHFLSMHSGRRTQRPALTARNDGVALKRGNCEIWSHSLGRTMTRHKDDGISGALAAFLGIVRRRTYVSSHFSPRDTVILKRGLCRIKDSLLCHLGVNWIWIDH